MSAPTNPEGHDVGTLALLDQADREMGDALDVLIETSARLIERRGRQQALCDMTAFINVHYAPAAAALLATALNRLAAGEVSSQ